jgi:hypothetical protein
MSLLRDLLSEKATSIWNSNFADRPSTLFSGVHQKVSIVLCSRDTTKAESMIYTTAYRHWYGKSETDERATLLEKLAYAIPVDTSFCWLKSGDAVEQFIYHKIRRQRQLIKNHFKGASVFALNMRMMYWAKCFTTPQKSNEYKHFGVASALDQKILVAVFNSTLYFWFWELVSDGWHITSKELENFFFDMATLSAVNKHRLGELCEKLMIDLEKKKAFVGTKQTEYEYYHRLSKPIIDEIDRVLAQHYGFTDEELDFIINYDIKYRMGRDMDEEEEV